jgi:hypothetical protein
VHPALDELIDYAGHAAESGRWHPCSAARVKQRQWHSLKAPLAVRFVAFTPN